MKISTKIVKPLQNLISYHKFNGILNNIKIYGICIPICLFFITLLINSSYAQSSDNFKNYTDNEFNFTTEYPSNWTVKKDEPNPDKQVWFNSPEKGDSILGNGAYLVVKVEEVERYLDTDTMTVQNKSLEQYAQSELNLLNQCPIDLACKVIRQNEITVGGNKGWKVEYSVLGGYGFLVKTIGNGKLYTLTYNDRPLKVPETLPLVNKIVESFQVTR